MATLTSTYPTLLDVARRMNPNGSIETMIAELLTETNEVLEDAVWIEGNLPTGHRDTLRTSLPTPTWRKINAGIAATKSTTAQNTDTIGILEDISEIDCAAANLNGNAAAWRLSEDRAHIDGISAELAGTVFDGNEATAPESFTGFGPRYDLTTAENGSNIFAESAGDTDATSIYLVGWGPDTVRMIYPKGSVAGIQAEDLGRYLSQNFDGANGKAMVYGMRYQVMAGLGVKDWRYVSRFQFDPDDVTATGSSGPVFDTTMRKMLRRIPNPGRVRLAWYMNRDAQDMIDWQAANKTTLAFKTIEDAQGKLVTTFLGIPVRRCDAITTAESSIS